MSKTSFVQKSERSSEEIIEDILNNVLTMLSNRFYLQDGDLERLLDLENPELVTYDDNEYTVVARNGNKIAIKITMEAGNTHRAGSPIANFAEAYPDATKHPKIYVCSVPASEVRKYGNKNGIQVFDKQYLRFDLLQHEFQPQFEMMSPKEQKAVLSDYLIQKSELPDMLYSDRVARYFDLPIGSIIRIIRPSVQTGLAPPTYRRIVAG